MRDYRESARDGLHLRSEPHMQRLLRRALLLLRHSPALATPLPLHAARS
jgi:hypothetical protein